jgi:hypothetical protein
MSKIPQMCNTPNGDDRQRPRYVSDKEWDERYGQIDFSREKSEEEGKPEYGIARVDSETGLESICGKEGLFETMAEAEGRAAFMNQSWPANRDCTYKAVMIEQTPAAA